MFASAGIFGIGQLKSQDNETDVDAALTCDEREAMEAEKVLELEERERELRRNIFIGFVFLVASIMIAFTLAGVLTVVLLLFIVLPIMIIKKYKKMCRKWANIGFL